MSAVRLSVDGIPVTLEAGATLLEAAAAAGVALPALCRQDGFPHQSACMACTVEESPGGRLVPACASPARQGLDIRANSARAVAARKAAVELLLSEHSGDCRAPCARACPAGVDVMRTVALMERGDPRGALLLTLRALPFPGLMADACAGLCERVCRRTALDSAIPVRALHDAEDAALSVRARADLVSPEGQRGGPVAVEGSGIAALSAAFFLMRAGTPCAVRDDPVPSARAAGVPASVIARLGRETAILEEAGCRFGGGGPVPARVLRIPDNPEEWRAPAREVARGRRAVAELLAAGPPAARPFESVITDIRAEELAALAACLPSTAGRCLSCGCAREGDCGLRRAARETGASRRRFHGARIPVDRKTFPMGGGALVFEPGKCIRCGICVRLSAAAGHPVSFVGRGFATSIEGFERLAAADSAADFRTIAAACPTGSLAWTEAPGA